MLADRLWSDLPAAEAVQQLVEMHSRYGRDWQWRRQVARRLASRYHGRDVGQTLAQDTRVRWDGQGQLTDVPLIQNKYNANTETFVSKIGATDQPKTALVCTEADWSLKQRTLNCSRLLEAEYAMRQGRYANVYKLAEQALRLAFSCTGSVAAKVYPWPNEKRVVVELHDTLDMFLDDSELTYGPPLTYGELTYWNPHLLAKRFDKLDVRKLQLEQPIDRGGLGFVGRQQQAELVAVFEGWRMAVGDEPGRYIAGLRDGTVLIDEEWPHDEPPFVFLHLMPQLFGFWAIPPLDLVDEEIQRSNEILASCDEAEFDSSKQVHYVDESQIVNIGELVDTHSLKFVRVKSPNYQPAISTPAPFDRISLELKAEHDRSIAQVLGIDDMHVSAKKEDGLSSGVAQREAAARFDNRFASMHRAYIQFVAVDMARHMLRAQKKLAESGKLDQRRWNGREYSKVIEADDIIDLDLDALQIQAKPISEIKNTPEERVQYAQELLDRGAISIEAYLSIQQTYDVPGETKVVKTQRRWISWQIDRWLTGDEDTQAEPGFYQGPRPWMRASDALLQVVDALMEAEIDGAPQERLDYFLNFIAELAPLAAAATPPPAPPVPMMPGQMLGPPGPGALAPPMGAPPMAPPMGAPVPGVM